MGDAWFRPKTYGYGATPANWQGWVATLVVVAMTLAATWVMIVVPALAKSGPSLEEVGIWALVQVVVTAGFTWLARVKCSDGWSWRWGETP